MKGFLYIHVVLIECEMPWCTPQNLHKPTFLIAISGVAVSTSSQRIWHHGACIRKRRMLPPQSRTCLLTQKFKFTKNAGNSGGYQDQPKKMGGWKFPKIVFSCPPPNSWEGVPMIQIDYCLMPQKKHPKKHPKNEPDQTIFEIHPKMEFKRPQWACKCLTPMSSNGGMAVPWRVWGSAVTSHDSPQREWQQWALEMGDQSIDWI